MITESIIKLGLAFALVLLGFGVYGAIIGTTISIFVAFGLSFLPMKDILSHKAKPAETHEIKGYTKPTFFIMLTLMVFYSLDIIMAKIKSPNIITGYNFFLGYSIAARNNSNMSFGNMVNPMYKKTIKGIIFSSHFSFFIAPENFSIFLFNFPLTSSLPFRPV